MPTPGKFTRMPWGEEGKRLAGRGIRSHAPFPLPSPPCRHLRNPTQKPWSLAARRYLQFPPSPSARALQSAFSGKCNGPFSSHSPELQGRRHWPAGGGGGEVVLEGKGTAAAPDGIYLDTCQTWSPCSGPQTIHFTCQSRSSRDHRRPPSARHQEREEEKGSWP